MGFFSSLFGQTPSVGHQLADVCFTVRQKMGFLQDYASNRPETPAALVRLEFSKDILMLLYAATIVQGRIHNHHLLMQTNEQMRSRYLSLLPVPQTSLVGDCLICEDELESIGACVAPGALLSQVRTARVDTKRLMSLVCDYRAPQFRHDLMTGALKAKQIGHGIGLWLPIARTFLSQIRGVPHDSIPFDDASYLSVAAEIPFTVISEMAPSSLQ